MGGKPFCLRGSHASHLKSRQKNNSTFAIITTTTSFSNMTRSTSKTGQVAVGFHIHQQASIFHTLSKHFKLSNYPFPPPSRYTPFHPVTTLKHHRHFQTDQGHLRHFIFPPLFTSVKNQQSKRCFLFHSQFVSFFLKSNHGVFF